MENEKDYKYGHTEEFRKKFGERLREIRKERGYTMEKVYKGLNLPRSTYSGWELGRRIPLSKSLSQLASFLETNVDYLMLKSDDSNKVSSNDIKGRLLNESYSVTWDGKEIPSEKAAEIAALIEEYLNKK